MGRVRVEGNRGRVLVLGILALVVAGALVAALGGLSTDNDPVASFAPADEGLAAPDSGFDGIGGAGVTDSATNSGATPANVARAGGPSGEADFKQIEPVPPTTPGSPPVPGSPKIVRTGELRVNVGKRGFGVAFDRVASIASAHGGFVAGSSTSSVGDARSGELTVRVPSDRFDAARRNLAALGKVEYQALRGEDVSGQLVDFDARLRSLNAQEEALRGLLGRAGTVGEVLQVQTSLFDVRQQIEQLTAQKQNLEQAASLSTLQVSIFEPGAGFEPLPVDDDKGLANAFRRAIDGAVAVIGGMILVVGWSVPIVVLGLVIWAVSRLFRRRTPRPPAPTPTSSTPTSPPPAADVPSPAAAGSSAGSASGP